MTIDHPAPGHIPGLRQLWKTAFGDSDPFLDAFFATAFSPDRCLYLEADGQLAAMCHWLPCTCQGRPLAYLYTVATHPAHRGQGFCRQLLAAAKKALASQGCSGILLVPGEAGLRGLYAKLGWHNATAIRELSLAAAPIACALQPLTALEYAQARQALLPAGAAVEGPEMLALLATQCEFYRGEAAVAACMREGGHLFVPELLGDSQCLGGIAAALGCCHATARTPGTGTPWAMYCPLDGAPAPAHFSLALD